MLIKVFKQRKTHKFYHLQNIILLPHNNYAELLLDSHAKFDSPKIQTKVIKGDTNKSYF